MKFFPLKFNRLKTSTIIKLGGGELMTSGTFHKIFFSSVLHERLQKSYKTDEGLKQEYTKYLFGRNEFFS
jgi:hypothetical protein